MRRDKQAGQGSVRTVTVYCLTLSQLRRLDRFGGSRSFTGYQEWCFAVQIRVAGDPLAKLQGMGFTAFLSGKLRGYVVVPSMRLDDAGMAIQRAFASENWPAEWVTARSRANFGV